MVLRDFDPFFLLSKKPYTLQLNFRFGEMNRKRLDSFGLESSSCFPYFDPFPLKKMED